LFLPDEMAVINNKAYDIWNCDRNGKEGLLERQQVNGFIERDAYLTTLLDDNRISGNIRDVFGEKFIWIGSDGSRYVGDSGWHPDGSSFDYLRVKILIYLDNLTQKTGCLRVIPGSHLEDFHSKLIPLLQRENIQITPYGVRAPLRNKNKSLIFGVSAKDIPAWAIETSPGDIIFIDQNIWHSSYGGGIGRALVSMTFGEFPTNEKKLDFVNQMYVGQLEHVQKRQWGSGLKLFSDEFINDPRPNLRMMTSILRDLKI